MLGSLILLGICAGAQERQTSPELVVSVKFDMDPREGSTGLDRLFLDSLEIELDIVGLRLSDNDDPDILLQIAYKVDAGIIEYKLSVAVVSDGSILFSTTASEALNFQFDTVLLGQARLIADSIRKYTEENMLTTGVASAVTVENLDAEEQVEAEGEAGLALDAGFGLFLALGEPARYFRAGYSFEVFAGYRFAGSFRGILGLSASMMYHLFEGYATDAKGYVITLGPGLRLKPETAGPIVPGFKASIGASLFMVQIAGEETRHKIIPSADSALTVDIVIGSLAFQVALGVKLLYENEAIIVGFNPGFGISL